MSHNFKNLKIWGNSMNLTDNIFTYCKDLPKEERYSLIDQMNRASCSIPSNIAEGSGKKSKLQFAEYLSISLSSAFELETQLLICLGRKYGNIQLLEQSVNATAEV